MGSEPSFRVLNCQRDMDTEVQTGSEEGLGVGCGSVWRELIGQRVSSCLGFRLADMEGG